MKQLEDETKEKAEKQFAQYQTYRQQDASQVGRLLLLYVDEGFDAHEHESHYVFDICYHNTTDIAPSAITGDMHSVNKANFAILHWFGLRLEPRFTHLPAQLKHLFCGSN
jgi:hypothetical protein